MMMVRQWRSRPHRPGRGLRQVAAPGDASQPLQTGALNVPQQPAKTTKVIRAAELSSKTYLETEADVEAYVGKLKAELLATVRSGQMARVQ